MAFLLAVVICLSPAPFWRARPDAGPCGTWVARGGAVSVTLHKGGGYEEHWHGTLYAGRWWVEDGGVRADCEGGGGEFRLKFERDGESLSLPAFGVTLTRAR